MVILITRCYASNVLIRLTAFFQDSLGKPAPER